MRSAFHPSTQESPAAPMWSRATRSSGPRRRFRIETSWSAPTSCQLIVKGCEVEPIPVSETGATGRLPHPLSHPRRRLRAESDFRCQSKILRLPRPWNLVAQPDLVEARQKVVIVDQSEERLRFDHDIVVHL